MDRSAIAIVSATFVSLFIATLGIMYLRLQKTTRDIQDQNFEISHPVLGKIKTNAPWVGALAVAAALSGGVTYLALAEPARFPVHANVMMRGLEPGPREVVVGIIPNNYMAVNSLVTTPESLSEVISVVDGEKSYNGFAYVRDRGRTLLNVGTVEVVDGTATFEAKLEP
jgi:hypothetical protein